MTSSPTIRFRCVTLRRSGATEIRVVQAASVDAARERLIAAGLEPVSIEPLGPSLFENLFRGRGEKRKAADRRWRLTVPTLDIPLQTLSAGALALATIPFTVAIGSWGLALAIDMQADRLARQSAPQIAAYRAQLRAGRARAFATPAMAAPGVGAVLARLATILPADIGLAGVARDDAGALILQIDTPDPDRVRPILSADPLFGAMRETGQVATDEGFIRVTLKDGGR